jgi:hypothetical protein
VHGWLVGVEGFSPNMSLAIVAAWVLGLVWFGWHGWRSTVDR